MSGSDSISSLIAEIYDAALDSSRWAAVLAKAANFVGGPRATLWLRNPDSTPDERRDARAARHWKTSVFAIGREERPTVHLTSTKMNELTDKAVVLSSPESLQRWLGEAPSSQAQIAIYGDGRDREWDEVAHHQLELLVPHIRRSLQIGKAIAEKTAAAATYADTLDGLMAGIFLVNVNGEMVHANASGHTMMADGAYVRCVKGKLTIDGYDETATFSEVLAMEHRSPARPAMMRKSELADMPGGSRSVIHAFPIRSDTARRKVCDRRAVAGMVLQDLGFNTQDAVGRMARHYGLARRERQVLEKVIEGHGLSDTAERLEIGLGTTKTYLTRLFKKTGTKRPIDLIKLCSAFRSPFAG